MEQLEQQMGEVQSILTQLKDCFNRHPSPENEILVRVMAALSSLQLALLFLMSHPDLGEDHIGHILEAASQFGPFIPEAAEELKAVAAMIHHVCGESCETLKRQCLRLLRTDINACADTARHLLKARELREQGMPEEDIQQFLESWKTPNVF